MRLGTIKSLFYGAACIALVSACSAGSREEQGAEEDDEGELPDIVLASGLTCQPFLPNPEDGVAAIANVEIACKVHDTDGNVLPEVNIHEVEFEYKDGRKVKVDDAKAPDPRTDWGIIMTLSQEDFDNIENIASTLTYNGKQLYKDAIIKTLVQKALISFVVDGGLDFGSVPVGTSISRNITLTNVGEYRARVLSPESGNKGFSVPSSFGLMSDCAENIEGQADCGASLDLELSDVGNVTDTVKIPYDDGVSIRDLELPVTAKAQLQATYVIGQDNFTDAASATGNDGLKEPRHAFVVGNELFISDSGNNRILSFALPVSANGASASEVYGQASFSASSANAGGSVAGDVFSTPFEIASSSNGFLAIELGNNRGLVWDDLADFKAAASTVAIGQANVTSNSTGLTDKTLNSPRSIAHCDGGVAIADTGNNRVGIWSSVPGASDASMSAVIGQANATSNSTGAGAAALYEPMGVWCTSSKLYVADSRNDRVQIFDLSGISTGDSATASVTGLNDPRRVFSDSTGRVFVVNRGEHQVLIWNSTTKFEANQSPDYIYPDPDDIPEGNSLNTPEGAYSDGTTLYVTDTYNHRTLVVPLATVGGS